MGEPDIPFFIICTTGCGFRFRCTASQVLLRLRLLDDPSDAALYSCAPPLGKAPTAVNPSTGCMRPSLAGDLFAFRATNISLFGQPSRSSAAGEWDELVAVFEFPIGRRRALDASCQHARVADRILGRDL